MDSESCKRQALASPVSQGGFSAAVNKHSEEIHALRWIMLNLLWYSFPSTTTVKLAENRMLKAGATEAEVAKLSG